MKFFSIIALASSFILAQSSNNTTSITNPIKCCPKDLLSCTIPNIDTCCSPYYGLVVLALQWYPTLGPSNEFTIHGLWPDYCDGRYAPQQGCDPLRMYSDNFASIVDEEPNLTNQLTTYWGSYKGDHPKFWQYEWGKHGTCVTTLEPKCYGTKYQPGQEVREYFKKVLELRQEYDLYSTFKESGLVPGRKYNLTQFQDAFYKKYKVEALFDCKKSTLNEIRLYFRVKGKDNYILTNSVHNNTCPQTGIDYPIKINTL